MPNSIQEKQELNEVLKADAFGVIIKKAQTKREKLNKEDDPHAWIIKYGVLFNTETYRTEVIESERIDLQQLIDSYKGECGMEAALRLIKLGRATAEDFADDGKHGFDVTGVPTFAGDALRALEPGIEGGKEMLKSLGIDADINSENVEELVKAAVEKKFNEIQAAAKKEEGGEK